MNDTKGFTLLEIIVVVSILAAVTVLAFTNFGSAVEKTRASEGASILQNLYGAQSRYQLYNGAYATNLADLDVDIPTARYFNAPTIAGADPIASITRSPNLYTLRVSTTGTITCVVGTLAGICTTIGY